MKVAYRLISVASLFLFSGTLPSHLPDTWSATRYAATRRSGRRGQLQVFAAR